MALALGCLFGKWLGPGVPAGDGVCRVWKVSWGGWGRCLEGLEGFGGFAGWQTAALKAYRKPLLWPWPWGACSGSGLGPGVPALGIAVALALGCLEGLEGFGGFAGWQTAALKAHRKPLLWPWPWGACSGSGLGPGVPAGDGVWRVWRVLEGLRAGKRQL